MYTATLPSRYKFMQFKLIVRMFLTFLTSIQCYNVSVLKSEYLLP